MKDLTEITKILIGVIIIITGTYAITEYAGYVNQHSSVPEKYISENNDVITLYPDGSFIIDPTNRWGKKVDYSYNGKYKVENNYIILEYNSFGFVVKLQIIEQNKLLQDPNGGKLRRIN